MKFIEAKPFNFIICCTGVYKNSEKFLVVPRNFENFYFETPKDLKETERISGRGAPIQKISYKIYFGN